MTHPITDEFLLWSELTAFWAAAAYGVSADPLSDNSVEFKSRTWKIVLISRCVILAIIILLKSHSFILAGCVAGFCIAHPLTRYRISQKRLAEFEFIAIAFAALMMWILIKHMHLTSCWTIVHLPMTAGHISALAIAAAIFLAVERGGTYIVKGCLKTADTLPHVAADVSAAVDASTAAGADAVENHLDNNLKVLEADKATKSENSTTPTGEKVDVAEINRGRLIGNLERLVLTLVVAAGSYSALGFLVAAKGLIRSEDFQKRDFVEYFLVGSLSSVLVALCAGLILRFVLISLWPELLSLGMQP